MLKMSTTSESPTLPKRKGNKRDRTRAKLLEAARALIREKGYERTTLREIARRAGMTSGAIYGNFSNRDDLFLALAEVYWPPITPRFQAGSTFADKMHALAEATIAAIPERRAAAPGRLTGMAYTLSHEEIRAKVQGKTVLSYEIGAEWLRSITTGMELPMPAEHLVRVIHALTEGLTFQRLLTPALFPDQVFYDAFAALAFRAGRS
jgi:AcrR family transcriptional regulator